MNGGFGGRSKQRSNGNRARDPFSMGGFGGGGLFADFGEDDFGFGGFGGGQSMFQQQMQMGGGFGGGGFTQFSSSSFSSGGPS